MTWIVPVADVALSEADIAAYAEAVEPGAGRSGARVEAFERAVARWTGARHAVAVSSGTAALHLACCAAGIRPGDEVLVPALTFLATASAPRYRGATPVLCDSRGPADPNLDPCDVERRISPRTRAVLAVHLWGYPAAVGTLRRLCDAHGLVLIEDAAQAIGAHVLDAGGQAGTVGHLGCLSFFAKKQLSLGEGGMVLTDDPELAARCRALRDPVVAAAAGQVGFEYELDEPRAALGLSRLPRLAADIEHRRRVVREYRRRLEGLPGLRPMFPPEQLDASSHFAFGVLFDTVQARERTEEALTAAGIQTTRYPALHTLTEYAASAPAGGLPNAEAAAARHLVLPLSSHITPAQVDLVVAAVARAVDQLPPSAFKRTLAA